jgi:predicted glycosyl hydrolase (DUF1957 family)
MNLVNEAAATAIHNGQTLRAFGITPLGAWRPDAQWQLMMRLHFLSTARLTEFFTGGSLLSQSGPGPLKGWSGSPYVDSQKVAAMKNLTPAPEASCTASGGRTA